MSWNNEDTNVKFKAYAHSSKESMREQLDEILEDETFILDNYDDVSDRFAYTLYEVEFDAEVDLDTGEVRAWAVNKTPLQDPIGI